MNVFYLNNDLLIENIDLNIDHYSINPLEIEVNRRFNGHLIKVDFKIKALSENH